MEPERNIEKELKAYAQRRRADAGAPAELHPVTRKLLQDEAALAGKGGAEPARSWWQSLWSSSPRIAVTGFAAVAIAILCLIIVPQASRNKIAGSSSTMELALKKDLDLDRSAAEGKTANNSPLYDTVHEQQKRPAKKEAAAKSLPMVSDDLNSATRKARAEPAPALPPPAPATVPAPAAPAPAAHSPEIKSFSGTASVALSDKGGTLSPAGASGGASLWADGKNYAFFSSDNSVVPVIQPYQRADLPQKPGSSGVVIAGSNVLVSFRVEQALDKLRMIDSDGSVYVGYVAQAPEALNTSASAFKKTAANAAKDAESVAAKPTQPLRYYRFRVSGTNRSLNQEVVFTGNFSTPSSPAEPVVAINRPVGSAAAPAQGPAQPLELRRSRLEGRVTLGGTNKIAVTADPVKP